MSKKVFSLFISIAVLTMVFAVSSFANVPPPPVNQKIGIPDSVFSNLQEEDCRFCHDNPDIVEPPPGDPNPDKWNVDRHHLRYGQPLETGFCSVNNDDVCTTASDCNENICSLSGTPCASDSDCPINETCGEECVGDSVAPFPPASDGTYQCTTCHPIITNGSIDIIAVRDCLFCHQSSPHHLTSEAQSQNCPFCHGDLVNRIGDGHIIPTYDPSLITPNPSGGNGEPANVEGNGAGACNYCHSTGTGQPGAIQPGIVDDPAFTGPFGPVAVYWNSENHHSTGLGIFNSSQCLWCHNIDDPGSDPIRRCEGCHGFESLHNICVDSDDADDVCTPAGKPMEENPGWSHVGNNNDCWGCHGFTAGFSVSSAPALGALTPYIDSSSVTHAKSGADTQVVLSGSNFQNTVETTTYTSNVTLTTEDGTSIELVADFVSAKSLTFTIPASTAPGNYDVRASKGGKVSNPVPIILIPDVAITYMRCNTKARQLTINGVNLGEAIAGAEEYINVHVDGEVVQAVAWSDTQIVVPVRDCRINPEATVNSLFGSEGKVCGKGCEEKKVRRRR
jgi:hypothetical protein